MKKNPVKRKNRDHKSFYVRIIMVILLISLVMIGIWYYCWAGFQESIQITPEQVVEIFENAGYDISDMRSIDGNPDHFRITDNGIGFDIIVDGIIYGISIGCADGWKDARHAAKYANDIFGGSFFYSFYYGSVVVYVSPPDDSEYYETYKRVGKELHHVLDREYRRLVY